MDDSQLNWFDTLPEAMQMEIELKLEITLAKLEEIVDTMAEILARGERPAGAYERMHMLLETEIESLKVSSAAAALIVLLAKLPHALKEQIFRGTHEFRREE